MTDRQPTLEYHPLANLFPLLGGPEFDDLVADIRANGQRLPILLHEGKIIDGRNRYRACLEAGVVPQTVTLDAAGDPAAIVRSLNLTRRHLITAQRAAIAAELEPAFAAAAKQRQLAGVAPAPDEAPGKAAAQAAQALNVSTASVERAKRRMREDPAAHELAKAGKLGRKPPTRDKEADSYRAALRRIEPNVGADVVDRIRHGQIKLATRDVHQIATLPADRQAAAIRQAEQEHVNARFGVTPGIEAETAPRRPLALDGDVVIEDLNPQGISVGRRLRPVDGAAIDAIKASIKALARADGTFNGLISPLTVTRLSSGQPDLICGMHRLLAVKELGWEGVPCRMLANVSAEEQRLIEAADNAATVLPPAEPEPRTGASSLGARLASVKRLLEELPLRDPDLQRQRKAVVAEIDKVWLQLGAGLSRVDAKIARLAEGGAPVDEVRRKVQALVERGATEGERAAAGEALKRLPDPRRLAPVAPPLPTREAMLARRKGGGPRRAPAAAPGAPQADLEAFARQVADYIGDEARRSVAARLGISVATLSRVLAGLPVSPKHRAHITAYLEAGR